MAAPQPSSPSPGTLLAAPSAAGVLVPALVAEAAAALQEELADGHGRHSAQPPPRHGRRQAAAGGGTGRGGSRPAAAAIMRVRGGAVRGWAQGSGHGTSRGNDEQRCPGGARNGERRGSVAPLRWRGTEGHRAGPPPQRPSRNGRYGGPSQPGAHPACFLQPAPYAFFSNLRSYPFKTKLEKGASRF